MTETPRQAADAALQAALKAQEDWRQTPRQKREAFEDAVLAAFEAGCTEPELAERLGYSPRSRVQQLLANARQRRAQAVPKPAPSGD